MTTSRHTIVTAGTRRSFLVGAAACLLSAPSIVRAKSLMPVRCVIMPIEGPHAGSTISLQPPPQEGFVRRLLFNACNNDLKSGRTESTSIVNGGRLSESEMRALVEYARKDGFPR